MATSQYYVDPEYWAEAYAVGDAKITGTVASARAAISVRTIKTTSTNVARSAVSRETVKAARTFTLSALVWPQGRVSAKSSARRQPQAAISAKASVAVSYNVATLERAASVSISTSSARTERTFTLSASTSASAYATLRIPIPKLVSALAGSTALTSVKVQRQLVTSASETAESGINAGAQIISIAAWMAAPISGAYVSTSPIFGGSASLLSIVATEARAEAEYYTISQAYVASYDYASAEAVFSTASEISAIGNLSSVNAKLKWTTQTVKSALWVVKTL